MKVAIINYEAGNVKSVQFALQRLGVNPIITDNHDEISSADKVIFPGVGQAKYAMEQLAKKQLDTLIPNLKQPVLGVCLGMQLMCEHSEEGNVGGLGIFKDVNVVKFSSDVKVPCIGWNALELESHFLWKDIPNESYVYFVHSYYVPDCTFAIAKTVYGTTKYSSAMQFENFSAMQFHPEKSGDIGSKMIENFLKQI